jgi:hypothetical protein
MEQIDSIILGHVFRYLELRDFTRTICASWKFMLDLKEGTKNTNLPADTCSSTPARDKNLEGVQDIMPPVEEIPEIPSEEDFEYF